MAAKDKYVFEQDNSPALNGFVIIPDNNTETTQVTRALYIGSGGDLNVLLRDDLTPVLLKNTQSGTMLPLRVKKVLSTNTTATNIIGLY